MDNFDFHIDLGNIKDDGMQDFSPIKEGIYELEATDWEPKVSKNNNTYIKVTYRVLGPTYANRLLWENYTISGENPTVAILRIKYWIMATGQMPGIVNAKRITELIGKPFRAKIGIEKSDGYEPKNRIVSYEMQNPPVKIASNTTHPQVFQSQSDEIDEKKWEFPD